jgi:DNA helicase II / ATP-dependent DNA helicase PcrA
MVAMANALINRNQRAVPKQLLPFAANQVGTVYVVQHFTVASEISNLAAYIEWYLANHPGVAAGEVLVLANRRPIGNGIRDELNNRAQQHNRPWSAQSFYFEDALSEPAAAEAFSLLALLVNQEDRPALRYWLGAGQDDCRWRPYARLRAHCEQSGRSPFEALQAMAAGAPKVPHTQKLMTRYALLVQRLTALGQLNMQQLVHNLFPAGVAEVATVRQIALLIATNVQPPGELLSELRTDIVQPELPGTQGPSSRIMSLHKSKGLTARLVVIAGCVSGILPTIKTTATAAEQARQMQEQRRLFYVGLTRSTETLVLSGAVRMPYADARQMNVPFAYGGPGVAILQASPFLAELGATAPPTLTEAAWRAAVGF